MKKALILFLALAISFSFAYATSIEEELQKMAEENATNYIQPFVTAFGTDMNGGLYHTALVHGILGFDVGFRFIAAKVPDEDMIYIFKFADIPFSFNYGGNTYALSTADFYPNTEAPTVFGNDDSLVVNPDADMVRNALADELDISADQVPQTLIDQALAFAPPVTIFGGINLEDLAKNYAPLPIPQASVGLPFNSEVLIRFLPKYPLEGFGDINFLGIGLKHQISKYIPMCPVDICAQVVYQKLSLGDIITNTNTAFNIHASRKFSLLIISITPYVGVGFESSNIKVDYDIPTQYLPYPTYPPHVSFDLKGENGFRTRVGFSTRFMFFKLYADYAIGTYPVASAGLMFSFR